MSQISVGNHNFETFGFSLQNHKFWGLGGPTKAQDDNDVFALLKDCEGLKVDKVEVRTSLGPRLFFGEWGRAIWESEKEVYKSPEKVSAQ